MAQLIQMRDRIRSIETIHKITHAMRLISMSGHSRFKNQERALEVYVHELNSLFLKVKSQVPEWRDPILYPEQATGRQLIIIIGAQKGLCGGFNSMLFKFVEREVPKLRATTLDTIALGKKTVDYVREHRIGHVIHTENQISLRTMTACARRITQEIMASQGNYERVTVLSNDPKTFFVQVPRVYTLVPFLDKADQEMQTLASLMQDYVWEQPAHEILSLLAPQCLEGTLQWLLFRSLLAEQAARFLSMDGATRNAKTLLETTRLAYNKLRQAKITREIIELSESV